MKKYLMIAAILFSLLGSTYAQEEESGSSGGFLGSLKFSAAMTFGSSTFMTDGLVIPGTPNPFWTISGAAPNANVINTSGNNITNMAGVQLRAFVTDEIAVTLSGGAIIRNTPARDYVPGVIDPSAPNVTWIPDYQAVTADNRFDANFTLGGEYHFFNKNNLSPYLGLGLPFYYARWSQYDPTYDVDNAGNVTVTDVAPRHVEVVGFGAQVTAGADYFLKDNLYIGLEIKPFSFIYAYNKKFATPGLESLDADTYTFGFFTQPLFKLGFTL